MENQTFSKMEMACSSIAVFFGIGILLALSWKLFQWVWLKPKKLEKLFQDQGLKGNPYRLLVGDVKDVLTLWKEAHSKPILISDDIGPRIIPEILHVLKKHGQKSYIWMGPEPAIIIWDFDLMKKASQSIDLFRKAEVPQLNRLGPGLVGYNGDKWVKHRKLINPVFHGEKLKHMLPAFIASADEVLTKWEAIVTPKGDCELDVWPYLTYLTGDAISRAAFSSDYEEGRRIFELLRELIELGVKILWSTFIPGWKFLPTKRNRRVTKLDKDVDDSIRRIINSRISAMTAGEPCPDDLLGRLLQSNFQEIIRNGNKEFGMSIEDVIEECKLFYIAGQESTSTLLAWTMVLLSRNPDWQARARDEVFQLFGNNEPDLDGLNRLKIITMILNEVLRLYSPLAVNIRRTADEETKLGNLTLPPKTFLLMPTILVHRDPEIWGEDAMEFKPDRFSEGAVNATKGKSAFLPFGWGPRVCVGQSFAMLETKIALVRILQRFSFDLSPSYSHAPISIITVKPEHGVHLILHKL